MKVIHEKQIFANGDVVIHFRSPIQSDYALCGQDLAGDSIDDRGNYENSIQTKEKITCRHCIEIVEYCKAVKQSEFKNI